MLKFCVSPPYKGLSCNVKQEGQRMVCRSPENVKGIANNMRRGSFYYVLWKPSQGFHTLLMGPWISPLRAFISSNVGIFLWLDHED